MLCGVKVKNMPHPRRANQIQRIAYLCGAWIHQYSNNQITLKHQEAITVQKNNKQEGITVFNLMFQSMHSKGTKLLSIQVHKASIIALQADNHINLQVQTHIYEKFM